MMGQFDTYEDTESDNGQDLYGQQDSDSQDDDKSDTQIDDNNNYGLDQMQQYLNDGDVANLAQNLQDVNKPQDFEHTQFDDPNYGWAQFDSNGDDDNHGDYSNNGDYNYDQSGKNYWVY